jgi:hypothetical protein
VDKVQEIESETSRTERALYSFLPSAVLPPIKLKETVAEHFDCVTIFHADIVGFNDLTVDCTPSQAWISEINVLHSRFSQKFGVFLAFLKLML